MSAFDPLAVYVHLPFCAKKCHYCAFNSGPVDTALQQRYLDLLPLEFALFAEAYPHYPRKAYTLFLGGGTPSTLSPVQMSALLESLFAFFPDPVEFTCEVNPQSANDLLFAVLKEYGCNRISIGLQTFDPSLLEKYGRAHGVREFEETYATVRAAGFPQVSFDLLYGHPDQSLADWARDLDRALALAPSHISLYGLKVEPHTPFEREGIAARQDDDLMADMFALACERLAPAGLERYELSNFARPGHQSLHNRAYWEMRDWVGFGLEAHSYFRATAEGSPQPYTREKTYARWFQQLEEGLDTLVPCEPYTDEERWRMSLIMGLRLAEGVATQAFAEHYQVGWQRDVEPLIARFRKSGHLQLRRDARGAERLVLPEHAVYVSNAVFQELV